MTSPHLTLREAFQRLKAEFERERRRHPTVRHFWLRARDEVSTSVLEQSAKGSALPLAEVSRWPGPDGGIDYSCFAGEPDAVGRYRSLADQARFNFLELLGRVGGIARHVEYDPHVAWTADMYHVAIAGPAPLLAVDQSALGEWLLVTGEVRVISVRADDRLADGIAGWTAKLGKPRAVHHHQALRQDVFTASVAMIDGFFQDSLADLRGQRALDDSVAATPGWATAPHGVPTSVPAARGAELPARPQSSGMPTRPPWVRDSELIGPSGHDEFARLMGISGKHLYRLIRDGKVHKQNGPTAKKFYFQHRDNTQQMKLWAAWEQARSKRR